MPLQIMARHFAMNCTPASWQAGREKMKILDSMRESLHGLVRWCNALLHQRMKTSATLAVARVVSSTDSTNIQIHMHSTMTEISCMHPNARRLFTW